MSIVRQITDTFECGELTETSRLNITLLPRGGVRVLIPKSSILAYSKFLIKTPLLSASQARLGWIGRSVDRLNCIVGEADT